ncbi:aldo/keto reductase [Streptomyces sp. E-08]|uniref:aldo/keto reductase n=1 Tax=Streptomyces sp. E-08 TaxID=3404047 RepID=UPI003CF7F932
MAQGLPALAAEQEVHGQNAGPRAGARGGLIPEIGSAPWPNWSPRARRAGRRLSRAPAQLALAWLLAHPGTVVHLPGMRRRTHPDENADALSLELAPADCTRSVRRYRKRHAPARLTSPDRRSMGKPLSSAPTRANQEMATFLRQGTWHRRQTDSRTTGHSLGICRGR